MRAPVRSGPEGEVGASPGTDARQVRAVAGPAEMRCYAPMASLRRLRGAWSSLKLRRLDKGAAELAFWRGRLEAEGEFGNQHYARFYTESFGLTRHEYAGKRILDVGCGPRGSLEWADEALERVGLDPLVDEYKDLGIDRHAMSYVAAGAEAMPFPDAYFDVVTSLNALDHVDDVDGAVAEMTRVAKRGAIGLLLVEVGHPPTPTEPQSLHWNVLERFTGWRVEDERRVAIDDEHDVYRSWEAQQPWRSGPGLLGATLRRL
jgi:SAM-dependent methyltransferase